MKKVKKGLALLLAVVFVMCLLSSCGAKKQDYVLPKTVKITDETATDDADGRETTLTVTIDGGTFAVKTDDRDYWNEDTYDEDGNHTVHRYYEFNELRLEITYRYDKTGKKVSWERYDLYEGRSSGKYSYDEAGNLTEEVSYDEDGALRWRSVYAYDEKGNRVRADNYDQSDKLTSGYTFEYDEAGRRLKAWRHEAYAEDYCHYASTYDASGRLLTDSMYCTDGSLFKQEAYTYDESGREVEKVVTYGEDGEVSERLVTVYEADGRSTRTVRSYDSDGRESVTIYRYDKEERVTEKGKYDEGMLGWWYVYTYDENGLPAKRSGRLGAGEDVLMRSEVTEYQTVPLTEAQYKAFVAFFESECGSYFS